MLSDSGRASLCGVVVVQVLLGIVALGASASGTPGPAGVPPNGKPQITGDAKSLEVLKQFTAGENSASVVSGTFTLETEHLKPYTMPTFMATHTALVRIQTTTKGPCKEIISVEWAIQGDLTRFSKFGTDANGATILPKFIASWDGRQGTVLWFPPANQTAVIYKHREKMLQNCSAGDPRGFSLFCTPIGTTIKGEGGQLSTRTEQKDGQSWVVLLQKTPWRTFEYWLDPSHNLVPKRIVHLSKDGNSAISETVINDYKLQGDGSWFITDSSTTWSDGSQVVRFHTGSLSFEPQPAAFFHVDIPKGVFIDKDSFLYPKDR
jgi:hypothetical protein